MKLGISAFIVIVLCTAGVFGYRAYERRRDLRETLDWMEQTYNPHEGGSNYGLGHGTETHYVRHGGGLTEDITQEFRETLSYKGGCNVASHSETVPVGVYKTVYTNEDFTFSLCDIDPDSIKIKTHDFHKDVFNCADPDEVKAYELNCTAGKVEFHTRNEVPKITDDVVTTFAELTGKDHESRHQDHQSKGWFIVDDVAYAERLAKALRHAVELCKGRTSKF